MIQWKSTAKLEGELSRGAGAMLRTIHRLSKLTLLLYGLSCHTVIMRVGP